LNLPKKVCCIMNSRLCQQTISPSFLCFTHAMVLELHYNMQFWLVLSRRDVSGQHLYVRHSVSTLWIVSSHYILITHVYTLLLRSTCTMFIWTATTGPISIGLQLYCLIVLYLNLCFNFIMLTAQLGWIFL
jgi:hypothetical protein